MENNHGADEDSIIRTLGEIARETIATLPQQERATVLQELKMAKQQIDDMFKAAGME